MVEFFFENRSRLAVVNGVGSGAGSSLSRGEMEGELE
jgi:hypothetical protein